MLQNVTISDNKNCAKMYCTYTCTGTCTCICTQYALKIVHY